MKSFFLLLLHATFLGKVEHGNDKIAVPERVTYTILKVNEIVFVNPHQVSAVEVQIRLQYKGLYRITVISYLLPCSSVFDF